MIVRYFDGKKVVRVEKDYDKMKKEAKKFTYVITRKCEQTSTKEK